MFISCQIRVPSSLETTSGGSGGPRTQGRFRGPISWGKGRSKMSQVLGSLLNKAGFPL
uniref:Alternative protein PC n=1 Tax=Homo sapiens TaxID=9606 RepID=L8E6S8_HUMAN|nr:alternative protein PC [Homo sapiens]